MKKIISVLLAVVMALGMAVNCISAEQKQVFDDVKPTDWFYDAVMYAYEAGVINGMGGGKYAPKDQMTRAQVVTLMARLCGESVEGYAAKAKFSDVKATDWYANSVGWASEKGLVGGYPDGTFGPGKAITRQEMAKLFVDFFKYTGYGSENCDSISDSFTDAATFPSWSAEYIEQLRLYGLIAGDNAGNFNPKNTSTRAEMATLVTRYLKNREDPMYAALENFISDNGDGKSVDICLKKGKNMNEEFISEMLLEIMGLDGGKYEIVFDERYLTKAEVDFNCDLWLAADISFPVRVYNTVSGKLTDAKELSFTFYKTPNIESYVVSKLGSPVVEERKYGKMITPGESTSVLEGDAMPITLGESYSVTHDNIASQLIEATGAKYDLYNIRIENEEAFLASLAKSGSAYDKLADGKTLTTDTVKVTLLSADTENKTASAGYKDAKTVDIRFKITKDIGKYKKAELPGNGKTIILNEAPADAAALEKIVLSEVGNGVYTKVTALSDMSLVEKAFEGIGAGQCDKIAFKFKFTDNTGKYFCERNYVLLCTKPAESETDRFSIIKNGIANTTFVIEDDASDKIVNMVRAIRQELYDRTGLFIGIIEDDETTVPGNVSGKMVLFGESKATAPSSFGDATSYDYVIITDDAGNLVVGGRTEGAKEMAVESFKNSLKATDSDIYTETFGIFDRELPEVEHAFDKFCATYYGDPFINVPTNEVLTYDKIVDGSVEVGVDEVPMSQVLEKVGILGTRQMIKKYYDRGIKTRLHFWPTMAKKYIEKIDDATILGFNPDADIENIDKLRNTPQMDYNMQDMDVADTEEFIEMVVKGWVDVFGNLDGISGWLFYDEPQNETNFRYCGAVVRAFEKYDTLNRPVYVNLGPFTQETGGELKPTLDRMNLYCDLTNPPYYCFDRYPFKVADVGGGVLETRMTDEGFYENMELMRDYSLDNSKDCGLIIGAMKVGGNEVLIEGDCGEIDRNMVNWETNLVSAYGFRYVEYYVYYHVHTCCILDENNDPTWRWYIVKDNITHMHNLAEVLLNDEKVLEVFHLADEDGTYDKGVTPYYSYKGLGEITGCDAIISYFTGDKVLITDKRCDPDDGPAHDITVKGLGADTQWYNEETSQWESISTLGCANVTEDGLTLTLGTATQYLFKMN